MSQSILQVKCSIVGMIGKFLEYEPYFPIGVGKSSLIFRYQQPIASIDDITTTIGVDYVTNVAKMWRRLLIEWLKEYFVMRCTKRYVKEKKWNELN